MFCDIQTTSLLGPDQAWVAGALPVLVFSGELLTKSLVSTLLMSLAAFVATRTDGLDDSTKGSSSSLTYSRLVRTAFVYCFHEVPSHFDIALPSKRERVGWRVSTALRRD